MTFAQVIYIKRNFKKRIKFNKDLSDMYMDGKWAICGEFDFLDSITLRDLFDYAKRENLLICLGKEGYIAIQ